MMKNKRLLAALICAALMAVATGCGSAASAAQNSSTAVASEAAPSELMDKDAYLEELVGLDTGVMDFAEAVTAINDESIDNETVIQMIRNSKNVFVDFSEINNPPAGYEQLHGEMTALCSKLASDIDRYADTLQSILDGEAETTALDEIVNDISADGDEMSRVREEIGAL